MQDQEHENDPGAWGPRVEGLACRVRARRMTRVSSLAVSLLVLAGCDLNVFGPEVDFKNQRPLRPPPEYAEWYAAVEACRGKKADYSSVRWFVADSITYQGVAAGGYRSGNDITIRADFLDYMPLVRHEADHQVTDTDVPLHLPDGGTACDGIARLSGPASR